MHLTTPFKFFTTEHITSSAKASMIFWIYMAEAILTNQALFTKNSPLNSFACLCWYSSDFFQIYTEFFTTSYYLLQLLQSSLISASNNPFTRPQLHHSSVTCLILCGFFSNTGGIFEPPVKGKAHNTQPSQLKAEWRMDVRLKRKWE